MQITVESTTKESKQARGQTYWGVKFKGDWYNLFVDNKPNQGNKFEVDVKTSEYQGKTYRWATPVKTKEAPQEQAAANGTWEHYAEMARAAHLLAQELEPDINVELTRGSPELVHLDRSEARMAFVQSIIVAFREGKVALPAEPEPPEFGPGEDVPF